MAAVPDYLDLTFDVVDMYYQAATAAHSQAVQFKESLRAGEGRLEWVRIGQAYDWGDDIDLDVDQWEQVTAAEQQLLEALGRFAQALTVTHIMCTQALEANINLEAAHLLSGRSLRDFDSLSLKAKWSNLPVLAGTAGFGSDAQPFLDFRLLVQRRNKLVHAKGPELLRLLSGAEDANAFLASGLADAARSLSLTREMVAELAGMLSAPPPAWVFGAPTRYYTVTVSAD